MKTISSNADLKEAGLDDIANLQHDFAMPRMLAGQVIVSAGQGRLASRASLNGSKPPVTVARYYVVEMTGKIWPIEIGRLRNNSDPAGTHAMPPLGGQRLPIEALGNVHRDVAMKLDPGQRALVTLDAAELVQMIYPQLGWQAAFERATIHYTPTAAPVATLLLVRRTA